MVDEAVSRPTVDVGGVTVDLRRAPLTVSRTPQAGTALVSRGRPATQQRLSNAIPPPAQPRQQQRPLQLELPVQQGQTVNFHARSMRIEPRARTLRLRLIVLAGFSFFSLPLFFVGGAAGLASSLPYLVTDCSNIKVFLFLRVQRARLTQCLSSLTAALCFALVPVFLLGTTLLERDGLFSVIHMNGRASPLAPPPDRRVRLRHHRRRRFHYYLTASVLLWTPSRLSLLQPSVTSASVSWRCSPPARRRN